MDEIRAKRLAKLAQIESQREKEPVKTKENDKVAVESPKPQKKPVFGEEKTTPTEPLKKQKQSDTAQSAESFTAWTDKQFEEILSVTLNPDHSSSGVTFLEATYSELAQDSLDLHFNKDLVDRALIERLSEIGHPSPFQYLKDSWGRIRTAKRFIKAKDPLKEQKLDVLNEMDRLCSSYGLVAFQIPDMFQNSDVLAFCRDIIRNEADYSDFLLQIINRSDEEGTILEFLNIFVPTLSQLMLDIDLNDSKYPLVLNILQLILNQKSVASVFTQIEGFKIANADIQPSQFEASTILGRVFRLSPLEDSVAHSNFSRKAEMSNLQVKQVGESLQVEHKVLLDRLFFIADKIIRGSETSRNDLLSYFATIINKNHLRRGDHSDSTKLSSNAFITNISLILIRLSQPFLDPSFSKIDRIDIEYFNKSSLIDLKEETRTNSTIIEADEYFKRHQSLESANFISHCFYLTLTYLHYGIGGNILYENKLKQKTEQMELSIEQLKKSINTPNPMQRFAQVQLTRLESLLLNFKCQEAAIASFFMHRDLQLEVFDFISGASCFLIRAIDPAHKFPQKTVNLPLIPDVIGVENADNTEFFREKAPVPFKYFPEFIVEGIINYVQYIAKYIANPLIRNSRLTSFVEFAVVFLRCPELIGNPHLKGKLVEALFIGSYPSQDSRPGIMMDIFDTNEIVTKNLLYALLEFYVVVEKTGASSQFYDKFNSRYHISFILEQIWKNPLYKNQLVDQSENNEEFFIRFIARMLNDLTFLLDESLRQLSDVHSFQVELETRSRTGVSNLEGTDDEIQQKLSSAENQAKSYVRLANESIDLFGIFTKDLPRAFMKPEIVNRLASMLDYNLDAFVGPKCSELKVSNPEKYSFSPRTLLLNISKVFVNLSKEKEFIVAVSKDSRSFKKSLFLRAESILSKYGLASQDFISKLVEFANAADSKRLEEEEEELELGDIPDDFLDPLMFTLMKDPVILPSSKISIDRSTIRAHLLSDSTDPFNRMPLRLEDVVPNDELKTRIEEFKLKSKVKKSEDIEMKDS